MNTLLRSHSLVKSTVPKVGGMISINNVKIIYNNANVTVHGIESFLDPAFPILYPIFYQQVEDHVSNRYCSFQVLDMTR